MSSTVGTDDVRSEVLTADNGSHYKMHADRDETAAIATAAGISVVTCRECASLSSTERISGRLLVVPLWRRQRRDVVSSLFQTCSGRRAEYVGYMRSQK
jgi:hypothetical protein